ESSDFAGKDVLLFLADCAKCQMANYFKHLAEFEKSGASRTESALALFDSSFPESDLRDNAREFEIHIPIYVLKGNVDRLRDEYATRVKLNASGPLRITCDSVGVVTGMGPLVEGEQWREEE